MLRVNYVIVMIRAPALAEAATDSCAGPGPQALAGTENNGLVMEAQAKPTKMWGVRKAAPPFVRIYCHNKNKTMSAPEHKLLLVEDEVRIAEFVLPDLTSAGFAVTHVKDGANGLAAIMSGEHDLVILDVMLPLLDGFEVLSKVREAGNPIPVIILSARSELPDRLQGFEIGADDYLPKPFFVEELIARVRAVMARKSGQVSDEIVVGELTLNKISHQASWRGTVAQLSQREFNLVECLMRAPNRIFSRQQILKNVWGISFNPETNVVDVCIQRIRKKLNRQARDGKIFPIETIRGVGYRFQLEEEA